MFGTVDVLVENGIARAVLAEYDHADCERGHEDYPQAEQVPIERT